MTRLGLEPSLRDAKIIISNRIIRARIIRPMIKGSEAAHDLPFPFVFSPLTRAPEPFLSACFSPAGASFPETDSPERASVEAVEPGVAVESRDVEAAVPEPGVDELDAVDNGEVEVDVPEVEVVDAADEPGADVEVDAPGDAVEAVEPGAAVEVDAPGAAVEADEPGVDDAAPGAVVAVDGEVPVCREGCVVWAAVEEGEACVEAAGRCEEGRTITGLPEDGRFDSD